MQLLTANPSEYEALHDGRRCPSLGAHVDGPRGAVASVLITEPVANHRLYPLRRQDQQDCTKRHNYAYTPTVVPCTHGMIGHHTVPFVSRFIGSNFIYIETVKPQCKWWISLFLRHIIRKLLNSIFYKSCSLLTHEALNLFIWRCATEHSSSCL
jgi:hypothetical protein